jgi:hypothetical protein
VFINWRKIVLREVKFVKLQKRWKFLGFCSSVAEVFVGLPWTPCSLRTGEQTCLLWGLNEYGWLCNVNEM